MSCSRGGADTRDRRVGVAQVDDQGVELAQRRTAEVGDGAQRAVAVAHLAGLGLHDHRGHVVADDVVQLAGQRRALLEPGVLDAQLRRPPR